MRVALFHDFFARPGLSGGGEKLAILLAETFHADIFTGFVDPGFKGLEKFNVVQLSKNSFSGIKTVKIMKSFEKIKLDYDFFIFSGTNCITAAEKNKPNILYMHTPPRYIYDLKEWYEKNTGFFGRIGLWFLRKYAFSKDQHYIRQFDRIVTNSENVRKRILKYYGKDVYKKSSAVYSFVDIDKYKYTSTEDYYVSNARLDPLKRVDVIVEAFCKMPDKKLIILSTGKDEKKIRKIAKGHENIVIKGWVSEEEMIDIISRSICTIQMPVDEDLGLGAIESMACGKPCIGADEGGLKETIINKKTGILVKPSAENVISAVRFMTAEKSKTMRKDCLKNAKKFSKKNFIKKFKKEAKEAIKSHYSNTKLINTTQ